MDERQRATLIGFFESHQEREKLEFKLMLYEVIKVCAHASTDKGLLEVWKKAYKETEKKYMKMLGVDIEEKIKKEADEKFRYKGGRKVMHKF